MNISFTYTKHILNVILKKLPAKQFAASILLLAIVLPIAAPIPVWAQNLNLPPKVNTDFRLTSQNNELLSSSLNLFNGLATNLGMITKIGKGNENPKEKAPSKAVLAEKVKKIKSQINETEIIKVGEKILLNALPLDEKGSTVQGLAFEWKTADSKILQVTSDGEAIALAEGETVLTAELGKFKKDFSVSISNEKIENNDAKDLKTKSTVLLNQLPPNEVESKYNADNNLGNPPGQTEMDSTNQPAVGRIRHRAGIANFNFGLPLAGLSGRGVNAEIGVSYNSRTWNKSLTSDPQNPSNTVNHFTYDVEESWVAPGFSSGFGYLESRATTVSTHPTSNTGVFTYFTEVQPVGLTDADGTRHQFTCSSWVAIPGTYESKCTKYTTDDGTFITTAANNWVLNPGNSQQPQTNWTPTFTVNYPNGSKIYYGGNYGSGDNLVKKQFAYFIQDSNGNRIQISYLNDGKGRIDYIRDTMNRYIRFYYDNSVDKKLVAITKPAFGNTTTEQQVVRFYYEEMPLNYTGKFSGVVTAPANIKVLRYIYYPSTNMGFKYDYHANFGMIYKIQRFQGMQASSTLLTETGTITSDGSWAATTQYNYPTTTTPIDDVPKYTERTDDWYGRDTANAAPITYYDAPEPPVGSPTSTSRVETSDGITNSNIINETLSHNTGDWKNGLVSEMFVKKSGPQFETVFSKTKYYWEQGQSSLGIRRSPILRKVEVTNDAGQTKATRFEYDEYNNQTKVEEFDFAPEGQLGTLLRTTETTYQKGAGWLNRNLLNLPTSIVTKVNNVAVSKTLIEYDHNGNDSSLVRRDDIDTNTHDVYYNPAHQPQCWTICPDGTDTPCGGNQQNSNENGCVTVWTYGYNPASAYRGNVTKVTSFSDATLATDPNAYVSNTEYDIAGNTVELSASCCRLKAFEYDKANEYAYAISEEKGDAGQLVNSVTYDRNTGLILTSTDENNQVTSYTYDQISLRNIRTDKPNGAWSTTEYGDQSYPFYVKSTNSLDTNRSVSNWSFADGRGATYRSRSQTLGGYLSNDIGFDKVGNASKTYSPYKVVGITDSRPTGILYSEILQKDGLGRVLQSRLTDNTIFSATYYGTVYTSSDEAGKQHRQISDAIGRTIRIDEPDANGNLGAVSSPFQPTHYEYDGNNNLIKVTQFDGTTTQERLFKYDSLSRLTHEKQVEATPTLSDAGVKVTNNGLWTGVYKYNTQNLLVEGIDARGVKTNFSYDGLSRVSAVTYTGESGYQTPTVTYTYDEIRPNVFNKGRLTKVKTAAVLAQGTPEIIQNYDYDKVGQLVNHNQNIGNQSYNLNYSYNLAGQLVSEQYPSGKVVNYTVDDYGRLQNVSDAQRTYLNSVAFNNQGLTSQINLGNGTNETFNYNDRFQMTSQSLNKGSQVLQKYDYGYGQVDVNTGTIDVTKNNGQLGKIDSYIGTNKQFTQRFGYDSLGRLSESREYRGDNNTLTYKQKFDFDRFGNMYRKAANNAPTGQTNPLPYTPIEDADISKASNRLTNGTTYNEAGMVVTDNKFRSLSFAYDANGRLVNATNSANQTATTVYDASGNRVATKINDVWQFIIYNAFGKLVAEYGTQSGGNGGVSYLMQDWQGSVRASVNSNGFIQARADFTAFGEEISLGVGLRSIEKGYTSATPTRNSYALTEKDSTGLNHALWRKNENRAGRWTSPDPYKGSMNLGNPQSFNRYTYVENDPVNYVDPSGLQIIAFIYPVCTFNPNWETEDDMYICKSAVHFMYIPDPVSGGGEPGGGGGGGSQQPKRKPCPVKPLSPITDSVAQRFESGGGSQVDTDNLTSGTKKALGCLTVAIWNYGLERNASSSIVINSGYRPQAYQDHLREVWDKAQLLRNNKQPECQALRNQVLSELAKHQVTERPAKSSNHSRGTAFDVSIRGVSDKSINAAAKKCGLGRGQGHGGGHHFNYLGSD